MHRARALPPVALACAAALAPAPAHGAAEGLRVAAKPGLSPSFQTGVGDYVSGCSRKRPLRLSIAAPHGGSVSVDGAAPRSGRFEARVKLRTGQATSLAARSHAGRRRYHVRCLPSGFPRWSFQRFATPQAQWYLIAPSAQSNADVPQSHFVVLVDGHGVPVWWKRTGVRPFNGLLLPNGDLAWTRWYADPFGMRDTGAWEVHRLDGALVRTLQTIGSPTDTHDMRPLANGHYLLITYRLRRNVALAPYGRSGKGNVLDGEIQELTAGGELVWRWSSKDRIRPSETRAATRRVLPDGTPAYDVFHLNSVDPDGNDLVISARHANAVYGIDRATGDVRWKLGGSKRPKSLRVLRDPLSPTFGKQHDARVLPDGTVTVYDNRTDLGPPRAARFRIDAPGRTATLIEQVTDPKARRSASEGSARRLPGGDWVVSWGGESKVMSEISAANRPVFRLKLRGDMINYRIVPIPRGRLAPTVLRRAMDRMFPR